MQDKMRTEDIVRRFVDSALEQLRQEDLMRLPVRGMPDQMVAHDIPRENDWIGWKAIPSTVTDAELDEIETQLRAEFPPAYRMFLKYKHFYALTETGVRFCRHPVSEWLSELTELYQGWDRTRIVSIGLIPFGSVRV